MRRPQFEGTWQLTLAMVGSWPLCKSCHNGQERSDLLFERLRQLIRGLDQGSGLSTALLHVHVFDSAGMANIDPALPGTTGKSGDWINEIHLSSSGYGKLGQAFGAMIDDVLAAYP